MFSVILEKKYSFSVRKIFFLNIQLSLVALPLILVLIYKQGSILDIYNATIKSLIEDGNFTSKVIDITILNNSYRINNIVIFLKLFVTFCSIFCLFHIYEYTKDEISIIRYEYVHLILFNTLSLFLLTSSNDFLIFFMGIELLSFGLYILSSYKKNKNFSTEAGLKYYILGGVSGAILLLGVSLVYGASGLINFDEIKEYLKLYKEMEILSEEDYLNLRKIFMGFLLISISLFIKLGAAPFHIWVADIYEGVMTPVTLYLSTVPKIILYFILFKFYFNIFIQYTFCGSLNFILMGVIVSLVLGA